jgi:hypothetical protein
LEDKDEDWHRKQGWNAEFDGGDDMLERVLSIEGYLKSGENLIFWNN